MKTDDLTRREAIAALAACGVANITQSIAKEPSAMKTHLPHAKPEEIGLDGKQLQIAFDLLEKWTTGKDAPIPSGAILVGRNGKVVPPRFFGRMGPEADAPAIRNDAMFLMASITKPITYMGAMLLVERGMLNLNDPVVRYIPEFTGGDKEHVLVRNLFTHTSGLPDMLPDDLKLRSQRVPLQRFLDGAAKDTKLLFKPGTKISYQSMGTALVADIIQRLSGKSIAEFLKTEIFDKLGMSSSGLGSKGFARERLVRVQTPDYQTDEKSNWNSEYWQQLGAPWGGMFCSSEDFAVICQLLLNKGSWAGVRLLSPASVRAMTTNRLLEEPNLPEADARARPWGLGWRLNHPATPESWGDLLGKEVFGHTGATGTTAWIDPQTQGFCILLTNAVRSKAPWRLVHLSNAIAAAFV